MSYSFSVRAATKEAAKAAIASQLDAVVGTQVCHKKDREQAQAAASSFIDLLADDDSKDVVVSMNGSLGGAWEGTDVTVILSANVGVNAGLAAKLAPAA